MARTEPTKSAFETAVESWLSSPGAGTFVEGLLGRKKVWVPPTEVLADVRSRLWLRLQKPHDRLDPAAAAAYCRKVAENVVRGLLRDFEDVSINEKAFSKPGALAEPERATRTPDPLGEHGIAQIRTACETSGRDAWMISGALTYLTVGSDKDCDVSAAPRPRAGANETRALLWPALWFAGRRTGLFPSGGRQNAAQRQKLKRAGDQILDLVNWAASAVLGGGTQ
jgi:hypothetical protein